MPLSDIVVKYRLSGTVIHAGAHLVQEKDLYRSSALEPVFWIEAIPELAEKSQILLESYPNQAILEGALWSKSGERKDFNLSSNQLASSSFLQMGLHKVAFPEVSATSKLILTTTTLDEIPQIKELRDITLLVLDIQGAELEALNGAVTTLDKTKYIFTEVSILPLYKNQATFVEILRFLEINGFSLLEFEVNDRTGHGNALFGQNVESNKSAVVLANRLVMKVKFSIFRRITQETAHVLFKIRRALNHFGIPIYLMRRPSKFKRRSK